MFFGEVFVGLKKMDDITGTYVNPNIIAPTKAKLKVKAIGLNIFPSTPVKERIGINTINMIS